MTRTQIPSPVRQAPRRQAAPERREEGQTAAWLALLGGVGLMFAFSVGHQVLFLVGTTMLPTP